MKLYSNNNFNLYILLLLISLGLSVDLLAQGPPPPPGVPLDFGLSAFIAACVGYGIFKMKNPRYDEIHINDCLINQNHYKIDKI